MKYREDDRDRALKNRRMKVSSRGGHTSVSIAKSGFHESGGIILQIPNCDASGAIFFIYSNGSLNSSSVGLYVGASCNP